MIKEKGSKKNRILAVIFISVLFFGFLKNGSYVTIETLFTYLSQDSYTDESLSISEIENEYSSTLYHKKDLINLNGAMASALRMQGLYGNMGMYITDDNYIVSGYPYTTTDYEYKQIVSFSEFLEANGINLMYINEPTKYINDKTFIEEFGVDTYSNRNMDLFLKRIKNAGINTIDLRDNIVEEKIDVKDLFYRTDHHWTAPAGLWATKIIAQGLNDTCKYDIDTSIFDKENFDFVKWNNCWLGEQGRKVSEAYVGLDDYTEIKPNFSTSYTFFNQDGTTYEGTFDNFINEDVYNTDIDVYENSSWHYSYKRINCINNNIDAGRVLIIGDSFSHVTQPFLSLGIHQVDSLILRDYDTSFNLRDYIVENGYDTVIVAYAQFMVGAHDDINSANYRMFTFE